MAEIDFRLDPKTLSAVKIRYDVSDRRAVDIISDNCKLLKDLYESGFARLYWTAEDRESMSVIMQNHAYFQISNVSLKKMLSDMAKCEKETKSETLNTLEIIDNLGVFLELCFQPSLANVPF